MGVSRHRADGPGLERTQRSFRVYLTLLQGVFQRWIVKGGMEKFGFVYLIILKESRVD